jgi:hypothetical protein
MAGKTPKKKEGKGEEMNKKNIITWKDADQNLCTIAAGMLDSAMGELRDSQPYIPYYDPMFMSDGREVPHNYASATSRTIMTYLQFGGWYLGSGSGYPIGGGYASTLCWWCFQNIIRQRLKEARLELWKNLYTQRNRRESKRSSKKSRNRGKRMVNRSKFGRQPERSI